MKTIAKQFVTSFVNLFLLANFVVGSASYAVMPGRVSPVPDSALMLPIGIVTAVVTLFNIFRGGEHIS